MTAMQNALAALGAASPFLLLVGGWLVNRRLQRATAERTAAEADRTAAEARLAEANAEKASMDVQGVILANTKSLLAEARVVQTEKDAIAQERLSVLTDRTNRLESRFEALRTALATHGVWDAAALIDLRAVNPEYPEPPPFPPHHH